MIIVEKLRSSNINEFIRFEKKIKTKNNKYSRFIDYYRKRNLIERYFLRKKFYIAKENRVIKGYILIGNIEDNIIKINNIYIDDKDKGYDILKSLIARIRRGHILVYEGNINPDLDKAMVEVGFVKSNGIIKLTNHSILNNANFTSISNVQYVKLRKNKDEEIRCDIQNDIFKSVDRLPISIDDIYYDEEQPYYIEDASYFAKIDDKYIGYGQLIKDSNNEVLLVNFGIKEEYRGKGIGNEFLSFILHEANKLGYETINLNVKSDNEVAYNMYLKNGFYELNRVYKYTLV